MSVVSWTNWQPRARARAIAHSKSGRGEGVFLTAVSGITGMVLGFAFTWVFFRDGLDFSFMLDSDFTFSGVVLEPVIVPIFRFAQVVRSLGAIAFVGVVASLYPAYRATRIDLAEAMKFEA